MKYLVLVLSILAAIVLSPIQASAGSGVFFVPCATSHVAQADPIISPGQVSAHEHEFFGNTSTNADSTYDSMVKARTTCRHAPDTAGYWVPTLRNPSGKVVRATSMNAYYRATGALAGTHIEPFPPDLRVIARRYFFHCGASGAGFPEPQDCGSKALHVTTTFPACWDGKRIDSLDHISHMAYQTAKGCPSGYVAVPRLAVVVRYPVTNGQGYSLSSGPPARDTACRADPRPRCTPTSGTRGSKPTSSGRWTRA
jgi:hypothetical protein